jgi:hypothetical protein
MSELQQQALSVRHFARVNGISCGSVYKEIREGRLKARKIGRRTIITTPDADNWRDALPLMATPNKPPEEVRRGPRAAKI